MSSTFLYSRKSLLYLSLAVLWFVQTAAIRVSDPQEQLFKEKTERLASKRIQKKKWRLKLFKFRLFKKKKATPQVKKKTAWRAQIILGSIFLVVGLILLMVSFMQATLCVSTFAWLSTEANCGDTNLTLAFFFLLIGLILLISGLVNAGKEKRSEYSTD